MSLKTECQAAIFNYVDADTQRNAALTGEHKEYVTLVIALIRGDYHRHVKAGLTEFVLDDDIAVTLTEECPW
jgi:hypothetical protein